MKEWQDVSIEEVRTLVAERQRYDDWLSALEAKRADTPSRVFERVHADYLERRNGVLEKLREHVGALSTLADDLETRRGGLDTRLAALEDERDEAMLRTAVGEYDGDRWEVVRQEVEASIGTLGEERDALLAEVDDVRTLLASARSEPEASAVEAVPEPEPLLDAPVMVSDPISTATDQSGQTASPTPLDLEAMGDPETSDQEAPVASQSTAASTTPVSSTPIFTPVVAYTTPAPTPAALPPVVAPLLDPFAEREAQHAAQQSQDELDATEFDDALALFSPSPAETDSPTSGLGALDMLDGVVPVPPETERPSGSSRDGMGFVPPPASAPETGRDESPRDPFDDLAFLRSVIDPATQSAGVRSPTGTEPQKTLRCTECGTMNFPTEWYCERCGGELAAF